MDLLSKLDKVNIQIIDRFPPEDMEYCRQEDQTYQEIYSIYSEVAFIAEEANARLKAFPGSLYVQMVDENKGKVYECNERFINMICGYFKKKYAVKIEPPDWLTNYEDSSHRHTKKRYDMVPLRYILDNVYDQMGGMSFEEKAFSELKEDARDAVVKYNGDSKYSVCGIRLVIESFYSSQKDYVWKRYMASVEPKHHAFFKALTHYEYGYYDVSQKYGFLCGYRIDENEGAYEKHPISSTIINSVRVYKNGKVEIEFKDYATAVKFMDIYFPGLPQQAAA